MVQIKDKVVLITGGASGLGFALAKIMSGKGAKVIAADRYPEKIKEADLPNVEAYGIDVTDWPVMENMFKHIAEKYGRLDIFCNNAGVFERM